jgi:hypothetical protein
MLNDKTMEELTVNAEMKTLVSTLHDLMKKGFTEDYKATDAGLKALLRGHTYQPDEVKVVDFYRFEGTSDPADESILYAIETSDGGKGTLVDAFGPSSDTKVTAFMEKVEEIAKKVTVK